MAMMRKVKKPVPKFYASVYIESTKRPAHTFFLFLTQPVPVQQFSWLHLMPTVCEDKTQIWSSGKGFFSAITFLKTDKKTEHLLISCVTLLFYQSWILLLQNFLKNLNPAIFVLQTQSHPGWDGNNWKTNIFG